MDRFARRWTDAARCAAKPVGGRRDRRCRRCARLLAADSVSILLHCVAGRLRLHGPGRVSDGPPDDESRPEREIVRAFDGIVRLRRSGHHGHAGHRKPAGPDGDDPDCPPDELLGPFARLFAADCRIRST